MIDKNCIQIDLTRDALFDRFGRETLGDRYLVPGETSPQQAFARVAAAYGSDEAHAQRLYDYVSKHWFMFATPLLSNGGTSRGLPISCFLNYVPDSRDGILDHYKENGWLASTGGGIGSYWGALRSRGEKTSHGSESSGVIPFVKVVDAEMLAFNQGVTRRGSAAVYLDINHPEVVEWIGMRRKSGGDENRKTLNLHNGLCITDAFMNAVERGLMFDLVDPNSKQVKSRIDARHLWRQILTARIETGEPYMFFKDTANLALPPAMRAQGLTIHASNLCSEIMLPTNEERTAVCCLSSVNLAKFDEWKDDQWFIRDLLEMLDNTLQSYIEKAPPSHAKAVFSASRERSVGLGAMGFHTYLQAHNVSFGSVLAEGYNVMMFDHIRSQADETSQVLGMLRGEAPDMVGTGERFAHKMAVAPNASSGIICGNVSPGIEPLEANAFSQKTLTGTATHKNPILVKVLEALGKNTKAVWTSIATNEGSVQHLDFLDDHTKEVFRTAIEIDQMVIVKLAADRQAFIDQGQSVNLFFRPDVQAKELHAVHFAAWKLGMKALYYCRSRSLKRASVSKLTTERVKMDAPQMDEECLSCQG